MRGKRSRLMRSASIGDAEVVTPPPRPLTASPDLMWQRPMSSTMSVTPVEQSSFSDHPRPAIFSISSPVHEPTAASEEIVETRNFCDRCYYCNRMISPGRDVFMYSELQAYCTEECRGKQMEMEAGVEKAQRASKRAKDLFGAGHRRQNTT